MSVLYIFFASFFENYLFKKINLLENRNFYSSMMFGFSSITLFVIYLSYFGYSKDDFKFLYEWKFYLLCFLELFVFYLYRENYKKNSNNYTVINMFVFSTIYLMPIVAYFYNSIFSFNNTLDVQYDSILEAIVFSSVLFVLTLLYYIDKIKKRTVNDLKLLILLLIVLLNTMYFAIKTMQTFNGFLVYSFIQLMIALYFLAKSKNEEKKITVKDFYIFTLWPFLFVLIIIAANLISVEFFNIFKRISQVVSAMILDRNFIKKDFMIIFMIIVITFIFYFYKVVL